MGEKPTEMTSSARDDVDLAIPRTQTSADDPAQIRAEIEQTRAEMSETIDAIQDKLSPQRIMEQAKDTVREATVGRMKDMVTSATDTASDLAEQVQDTAQEAVQYVRENPLPALLIGAGVTWLLMRGRRSEPRVSYSRTGARPGTREAGAYMYAEPRSYEQARTRQAQQAVGDVAERVQESWRHYSRRAETEFDRWMRENPLTVGAAAVALGAAVGLSMPRTETEDAWMGEARDTLVERAQEVAQDTVQQAQEVVDVAQDTVQKAQRAVGGGAQGGSSPRA